MQTVVVNPEPDSPRGDDNRRRSGRVFTAVIVAASLGGVGLTTVGLANRGNSDSVIVEDVDDVAAPAPSTVAPLMGEPAPDDNGAEAPASTRSLPRNAKPSDATVALSPLADLLGPTYSVVPEEVEPRPRPVRLDIEAFDVARFPVRAVGLEPDGQLEVPDETEIGWYQYGATAGQAGATVLAAHVSWNGVVGPFGRLGSLNPGDRVSVTLDDGTIRRYEVFERTQYGKLELPRDRIWRNTGPETLVLITCGGVFNPDIRRYRDNIVIYAAPVG